MLKYFTITIEKDFWGRENEFCHSLLHNLFWFCYFRSCLKRLELLGNFLLSSDYFESLQKILIVSRIAKFLKIIVIYGVKKRLELIFTNLRFLKNNLYTLTVKRKTFELKLCEWWIVFILSRLHLAYSERRVSRRQLGGYF